MKRIVKIRGNYKIEEIYVKNMYAREIPKKVRSEISLADFFELAKSDPTYMGGEVAGHYTAWVANEYVKLKQQGLVTSIDSEIIVDDFPRVLELFDEMKNRNSELLDKKGKAIQWYSFFELEELTHEYSTSQEIRTTLRRGRDYVVLEETRERTVYKIMSSTGMVHLGHYTNWCLVKDKEMQRDTNEYLRKGFTIFVVEQKTLPNNAISTAGEVMYPEKNSFWAIIVTPEGEIIDCVDENDDDLSSNSNYFSEIVEITSKFSN